MTILLFLYLFWTGTSSLQLIFHPVWPCLWTNDNSTVRVITLDDPKTCPFRFLPPFYCLRRMISFPITTMSSHCPINLEALGSFNLCVGKQALEGSIWPPIPFHYFTFLPFKSQLFWLRVWGSCASDWYAWDGDKRSIDVTDALNYLGTNANRWSLNGSRLSSSCLII